MKRCKSCGSSFIEEKLHQQTFYTDNTEEQSGTNNGGYHYFVDTCMMCGSVDIEYYWQEPHYTYPIYPLEVPKFKKKRTKRKPCKAKNRR